MEQTGDDGAKSLVESTQTVTYNTKFRIVGLDTYLNTGDTAFTAHHAVIVPDGIIGSNRMNGTNVTTGGYVGSFMFTSVLPVYNTHFDAKLNNHLLTHREILSNSTTNGVSNNWEWKSVKMVQASEPELVGTTVKSVPSDVGINYNQFPLFKIMPNYIVNRNQYWTKVVATPTQFVSIYNNGMLSFNSSSLNGGVRPCFCIG